MYKRIIGFVVILAILVAVIVKSIDFTEVYEVLGRFPIPALFELVLLSLLLLLVKAYRFHLLLDKCGLELNFYQTLRVFIASQATTPLPGGEAGRILFLQKEINAPATKLSAPVLLQAFFELFTPVIFVIVGCFFYEDLYVPAFIGLAFIGFTGALMFSQNFYKYLVGKLSFISSIEDRRAKLIKVQKEIHGLLVKKEKGEVKPRRVLLKAIVLSLVSNVIGGVILWVICLALDIDLSLFRSIFVYACGMAIQGLSTVVPGGLGFTEGGMTGLLVLFKVATWEALSVILIFRVMTFLFYIVLGLLFILIFYRKELLYVKH